MMSSKEQESKYQESHPNLRKLDDSGLLTSFYTECLSSMWDKFAVMKAETLQPAQLLTYLAA